MAEQTLLTMLGAVAPVAPSAGVASRADGETQDERALDAALAFAAALLDAEAGTAAAPATTTAAGDAATTALPTATPMDTAPAPLVDDAALPPQAAAPGNALPQAVVTSGKGLPQTALPPAPNAGESTVPMHTADAEQRSRAPASVSPATPAATAVAAANGSDERVQRARPAAEHRAASLPQPANERGAAAGAAVGRQPTDAGTARAEQTANVIEQLRLLPAAARSEPLATAAIGTVAERRSLTTRADGDALSARMPERIATLRETLLPAGAITPDLSPAAATRSAAPAPAVSLALDIPISDRQWGREFGERVGWVIQARLPSAQIQLNPEHLGPVELSLEVEDAKARVQFLAAHALTRDAIEAQLPKLRELLGQQGLDLTQADVGDFSRDADGLAEHADHDVVGDEDEHDASAHEETAAASAPIVLRSRHQIDTFV